MGLINGWPQAVVFLFTFVRWVGWQSSTKGFSQIWLEVGKKEVEKFRNCAIFW